MKGTTVYISNPTWGNHRNIFGDEGVEWKYYRCALEDREYTCGRHTACTWTLLLNV
jgi:aspartate/tyrosine/aromatic aminotransferase